MESVPPNHINPSTIELHSRALSMINGIKLQYMKDQGLERKNTKTRFRRDEDFKAILTAMEEKELFERKPRGRTGFEGFREMPNNIYVDKNSKDLHKYLNEHIKKFKKLKKMHNDFTLNIEKSSLRREEELDRELI